MRCSFVSCRIAMPSGSCCCSRRRGTTAHRSEGVAPANFIDWQAQARSIELLSAAEPSGFTYSGGDEPQSLPGMRVSTGFFDVFGMKPLYGRTFMPEEYTAGRNRVVVLSYGTWTQRFGGDRGIVGRVIRLNGQPYTVVGVMPAAFAPRLLVTFTERGVWTPKIWSEFEPRIRGARFYNAVARLKPGVTIQQAQAEFDGIAERLAQQYPRTNAGQGLQTGLAPRSPCRRFASSIGLLSGAVVLVLLIAMANTANLLMARAAARVRELAVRHAWVRIGPARATTPGRNADARRLRMCLRILRRLRHTRAHRLLAPSDIPGLAASA